LELSWKGVTMAELGVDRHFQVVDGLRAMSIKEGLK
jgi:hypothetical protein